MDTIIVVILLLVSAYVLLVAIPRGTVKQDTHLLQTKDTKSIFKRWMSLLDRADVVILDTETTGLGKTAEIIELAIINTRGETLFDRLIMPRGRIESGASSVHGITRKILKEANAPYLSDIFDELQQILLKAKHLCIYNAQFDIRILLQSMDKNNIDEIEFKDMEYHCIMRDYAALRQKWNEHTQDWKWHKLTTAARFEKVKIEKPHRALGDCMITLNLMRNVVSRMTSV